MMQEMALDEHKRRMMSIFNPLAATYDRLRFLQESAQRLIELAEIPKGAHVLDVATGTGVVALEVAQIVGLSGAVVGVDLSPEMLAGAQRKMAALGITNVEFLEGDAHHLRFADASFDVVLCASSLFFLPDMIAALREWRRVLAPGGLVGFSSYGPDFLEPLRARWEERMRRHGLSLPPLPSLRLSTPEICRRYLEEAGFSQVEVYGEQLGYYLVNPEERWADIEGGLEGTFVPQLPPAQRDLIRTEHLEELNALATPQGIWLDVPALLAYGRKGEDA